MEQSQKTSGEYGGISKIKARILFLQNIESLKPEVINEIESLLPLYGELNRDYAESSFNEVKHDKLELEKRMLEYKVNRHWKALLNTPERKTLKSALEKWGMKHNIAFSWVFEAALRLLSSAHIIEEAINKHKHPEDPIVSDFMELRAKIFNSWGIEIQDLEEELTEYQFSTITNLEFGDQEQVDMMSGAWPDHISRLSLNLHYTWNPFRVDKSKFCEYVRNDFERELKSYIEQVESQIPDKILKTKKLRNIERFEWTVRYQVCGESFNQISQSAYTSRETVTARVKETAEICGITLRPPGKPGRPKKNK